MSDRLYLRNTDDISDYGSDLDLDEAERLLDALQTSYPPPNKTLGIGNLNATSDVSIHSVQRSQNGHSFFARSAKERTLLENQANSTASSETHNFSTRDKRPNKIELEKVCSDEVEEFQSPLARFRTAPKKPLSVTDITAPAWCELQYWNNLQKYGRVKRTAAMKRGSSVHQNLENQIHQTVPVDVQTREDHWGLRLWNCIQGLQMLRTTGLTRELEVWGVFEGQVVNGVIDELSYACLSQTTAAPSRHCQDYSYHEKEPLVANSTLGRYVQRKSNDKLYLKDVKTRVSASLPKHSNIRPSRMQLMLYKKILSENANNRVAPNILFERYNLDPSLAFSGSLTAQLSALEPYQVHGSNATNDEDLASTNRYPLDIKRCNNLTLLWNAMISEYKLCLPFGAESIGDTLQLEYRLGDTGEILGSTNFEYDDHEITAYLANELKWWRGEREAKGVEIEEAFKCAVCEFADNCSWRLGKVEAALKRSHRRKGEK